MPSLRDTAPGFAPVRVSRRSGGSGGRGLKEITGATTPPPPPPLLPPPLQPATPTPDHLGEGPRYDWFGLVITVDFDESDLDLRILGIPDSLPTPTLDRVLPTFAHEFTHYMQSFCTPWGAGFLADLAYHTLQIGASIVGGQDLWDQGWAGLRGLFDRLYLGGGIVPTPSGSYHSFPLGGGHYEIGARAIREHMAFLAENKARGRSTDEGVELYVRYFFSEPPSGSKWTDNERWANAESSVPSTQPEYWLAFHALREAGYIHVADGLYRLCTITLDCEEPHRAFARFFGWLDSPGTTKDRAAPLCEHVDVWAAQESEMGERQRARGSVLDRLERLVRYAKKYADQISYAQACGRLAEHVLLCLERSENPTWTLNDYEDLARPYGWGKRIAGFRSPVVRFAASSSVLGAPPPPPDAQQDLLLVSAVGKLARHLGERRFVCPFLRELPVCVEEKEDACDHVPFHRTAASGEECILRNGVVARCTRVIG